MIHFPAHVIRLQGTMIVQRLPRQEIIQCNTYTYTHRRTSEPGIREQ